MWLCDTFSTMPDGTPIGDRGMLLADGAGLHATPPVRPVRRFAADASHARPGTHATGHE